MAVKLKCLIVDDEALARKLLSDYVAKLPDLELVASCSNAIEARSELNKQKIDILFLDIQMSDLTGIEFLRMLKVKPATILTTAYSEYAVEGYELDIVDYLLKPIVFERFFMAVNKAVERLRKDEQPIPQEIQAMEQSNREVENRDYFFVKADSKIIRVAYTDVLYIESLREYVRIHTHTEKIITLQSLSKLMEVLPSSRFVRIHRSHIINLEKIEQVNGNLVRLGGEDLQISKGQKEHFLSMINKDGLF